MPLMSELINTVIGTKLMLIIVKIQEFVFLDTIKNIEYCM